MFNTFTIGEWLWHGFWAICALASLSEGIEGLPVCLVILAIQYFTVYKPLRRKKHEVDEESRIKETNHLNQLKHESQCENYLQAVHSSDFLADCSAVVQSYISLLENNVFGSHAGSIIVVIPQNDPNNACILLDCYSDDYVLRDLLMGRLEITHLSKEHFAEAAGQEKNYHKIIVPEKSIEWEWCLLDYGVPAALLDHSVSARLGKTDRVIWRARVYRGDNIIYDSKVYPLVTHDSRVKIVNQILRERFPNVSLIVSSMPITYFYDDL